MLPGQKYTLENVVRILHAAVVADGAATGGRSAAVSSPTSAAARSIGPKPLIMVIPQRIPDSYVKSTVTASVEDRLRSISEQILSRSRLERIIQDLDLYQDGACGRRSWKTSSSACATTST